MSDNLREDQHVYRAALEGEGARDSSEDLRDEIDKLQGAVDGAAAIVRNNYLSFLLFGLYLAIIFGSTTHEQLLRETPVTLPILNVGLPLVPFFWVAPALFVLLHFNLLVQLYLLAGKLKRLDDEIGKLRNPKLEAAERARLGIFTFSHMLIGDRGSPLARTLPRFMAWTSVVFLPVALLVFGQIMFLPYHDAATTWMHRALVFLDIVLLWFLWSIATDLSWRWRQRLRAFAKLARDKAEMSTSGRSPSVATALSISSIGLDVDRWPTAMRNLPRLPGYFYRRHVTKRESWRPLLIEEMGLAALVISLLVVTIPGGFMAWPMDRMVGAKGSFGFPRNLVVRETNLVGAWPTRAQIDQYGEEDAWENFGQPIVLTGRDLRHGDFLKSNFTHADLRWADLHGAHLRRVNLQGARLTGVNPQGANLTFANLQGDLLIGTNLQGADLGWANLQGVVLRDANLQGAVLWTANLQGANLQSADLQGADLQGAELQGADLQGADLQGTDLQKAVLWRTQGLERANWTLSDLRGIDLDPPTAEEIEDWRERAAAISVDDVRERVLRLYEKLEEQTAESWTPAFGEIEGKALFDPWLFDPDSDDGEGWLEPMPFHLYESALAEYLIEIVCADSTPPIVAERIGWRAVNDARRSGRTYPPFAAKALLDPEHCPPAKDLPDDLRRRLESLLQD